MGFSDLSFLDFDFLCLCWLCGKFGERDEEDEESSSAAWASSLGACKRTDLSRMGGNGGT